MPKIYKPLNEKGNALVDITNIGYNTGNDFNEDFISIETEIKSEEEARTEADNVLQDNIDAEVSRATGAESQLDTRISDLENSVIKIIESDSYINANNTEANKVNLTVNVSTGNNNSSVSSTDEENTLTRVKDVNAAITLNRATTKENELNAAITTEVSRAQGVENEFNTRITTLETNEPKIISVTGQTITNPTEITLGSEVIFSTDSDIAIDTALSSITQNVSIGWTVKNTNATNNISITNNSEVVKNIEPNTSISGKWIKNTEGIAISVFKRVLGEGGNDWITWSGNNNSEVTLNIPDDVDIPLSFSNSKITKISGTAGGMTCCRQICYICTGLTTLSLNLPLATECHYMCYACKNLTTLTLNLPSAINCDNICGNCTSLATLNFNFGSLMTIDFTSITGNGGLGNITTLENITILEGGLAFCTSFNIKNSTNLTDASIQNIIDALPDYSGTETSALVSFPPDRLTTEQQTQLSNKGWTWS